MKLSQLYIFVITLLFPASYSFAQIPNFSPYPTEFVVIDADGLETSYMYASTTDFGEILEQTVTAEIVWARDDGLYDYDGDGIPDTSDSLACGWGTVMPDVVGKIALIRKGGCFFSQKIWNAQDAGAIGAIICQDQPDDGWNGGLVNMAGADSADLVTIPSIFITYEDCQFITAAIDNGIFNAASFRVSSFYNSLGPYAYSTPQNQIRLLEDIAVTIRNSDPTNAVSNIDVSVEIMDPNGEVSSYTETVDMIEASTSLIVEFDDYLPSILGEYKMTYSNTLTDEVIEEIFEITDCTWQMDENQSIYSVQLNFPWDVNWRYHVGNTYLTGSQESIATSATFMLENAWEISPLNPSYDPDASVLQIKLYDLDPNGDGVGPVGVESDYSTFQEVASSEYVVTGFEEPFEEITVDFENTPTLKANGQYALVCQYEGTSFSPLSPDFGFTSSGRQYPYLGTFHWIEQWTIFQEPAGQLDLEGWPEGHRPVIRLIQEDCTLNVGILDKPKIPAFFIYPNPSNDVVNLELDLHSMVNEVRVEIVDVMGNLISTKFLSNIQNEVTQIDVSTLSTGTYFMSVVTPEGVRSEKFIIAK